MQPTEEEFQRFMAAPVDQTTGFRMPMDFEQQVYRQNVVAAEVENEYNVARLAKLSELDAKKRASFLNDLSPDEQRSFADVYAAGFGASSLTGRQEEKSLRTATLVDPKAKAADFRKLGIVSPVKYQGICGSCWAFAVTGAFESSWAIHNKGQTITVSEEALLTCGKFGSCDGGTCSGFNYFVATGSPTDTVFPYMQAESKEITTTCPEEPFKVVYKADNWRFVAGATTLPDVATLKSALAIHGPLFTCIVATGNFKSNPAGKVFSEQIDPKRPINHCVLMVGWDDNKGAWLIKNSWSERWGEKGYVWVKYGSNKVGLGSSYVIAQSKAFPLNFQKALRNSRPPITSIDNRGGRFRRQPLQLAKEMAEMRVKRLNPEVSLNPVVFATLDQQLELQIPYNPGTGFTWSKPLPLGDISITELKEPITNAESKGGSIEYKRVIVTPNARGDSLLTVSQEAPAPGLGPERQLAITIKVLQ